MAESVQGFECAFKEFEHLNAERIPIMHSKKK